MGGSGDAAGTRVVRPCGSRRARRIREDVTMATYTVWARPTSKFMRRALYSAFPLAAAIGAYFATRPDSPAAPAEDSHSGHIASVGDTAQPVMVSAADARRIGVTFAVASFGDLSREIRVVGQI